MNKQKVLCFFLALTAGLAWIPVVAEEGAESVSEEAVVEDESLEGEDDWLNTVWSQVEGQVKEEEVKHQTIVTVAGVRGAEAEDNILDKLYYKGGKRYPSQDKLKKAIETLQKAVAENPDGKDAPKHKFFIAQCFEKIGQNAQAMDYYRRITTEHPGTKYAEKAQKKLSAEPAEQ